MDLLAKSASLLAMRHQVSSSACCGGGGDAVGEEIRCACATISLLFAGRYFPIHDTETPSPSLLFPDIRPHPPDLTSGH
jgi:hypothetical protein